MNHATLGFLLAVLGSFFFGIYMVPRKASKLENGAFLWVMGLSLAALTYLLKVITGAPSLIQPYDVLLSALCGVMWFIGSMGYAEGVRLIGLTRSTPVKNLGPIYATIYGVGIFKEFTFSQPLPLMEAVMGSLLMTLSAILFGRTSAPDNDAQSQAFNPELSINERRRLFKLGMLWSFIAALCFSGYSVPMKFVFYHMQQQALFDYKVNVFSFVSAMGLGVGISSVLFYLIKNPQSPIPKIGSGREFMYAFLAGLFWVAASAFASTAMVHISMAVSWPVTNLSTLISVAFGIWLYREIHPTAHRADIALGLITSALGVILLAMASSQGKV